MCFLCSMGRESRIPVLPSTEDPRLVTHWASQGDAPARPMGNGAHFLYFDNSITSPHRPRRQLCLRWMLKCPQEERPRGSPLPCYAGLVTLGPAQAPSFPTPPPGPCRPVHAGKSKASSILILPPGAKRGPRGREEPQGQGKMVMQASGGQWSLRDSMRTVLPGKTAPEF